MRKSFKLNEYLDIAKYISNNPGVYYILLPKNRSIESLKFNNKINSHSKLKSKDRGGPYSIKRLKAKQRLCENNKNKKSKILYIGKAKNLNNRINDYMNYLFCGRKSHNGGRAIGQIKNFENLICKYSTTKSEKKAKQRETDELIAFVNNRGCLPLANWRI